MSNPKTIAMDSQVLGLVAQLMAIHEERSKEHAYIAELQDELHQALQANKTEVRLNENLEGEVRRLAAEVRAKDAEIAKLQQEAHDLKCRHSTEMRTKSAKIVNLQQEVLDLKCRDIVPVLPTLNATESEESDFEYENPMFADMRGRRASAFRAVRAPADLEPSHEEWGGVEISGIAETTSGLNTSLNLGFGNISPIFAV
jgi:predicted nuclease with TOPRIM domain